MSFYFYSKMMRGRLACCAPIAHYVSKKYRKLTTSRFLLIYTLTWMAFGECPHRILKPIICIVSIAFSPYPA